LTSVVVDEMISEMSTATPSVTTEETNIKPAMVREQWLTEAVTLFRPHFFKAKLEIPSIQVSCGFPSTGGLSKNRVRGECWQSACTFDGTRHIFISPIESDPIEVLGILSHELLHSALPDDSKHGPKFKDGMKAIGLEGRARSAMPGPDLLKIVEQIAAQLGDYPNVPLKPKEKKDRKAQGKKVFKMFCAKKRNCQKGCLLLDKAIEEDYTVNVGKKSLKLGMPHCPCGEEMDLEEEEFIILQQIESNLTA
jgi:hypothetical protein